MPEADNLMRWIQVTGFPEKITLVAALNSGVLAKFKCAALAGFSINPGLYC